MAVNESIQYSGRGEFPVKYYVHCLVFVFFLFIFGRIVPPMAPITDYGMRILGVFFGTLYAWIFIDILWPSLIAMVALAFTGYASMSKVFAEGFGSDLVLIIFFIFLFTRYLEDTGLNKTFSTWLITRKALAGKPWLLISMIFLAAYIIAILMNIYAGIVVLWSITYNIAETVGYKKHNRLIAYILVGIAHIVMLGNGILPYKAWTLTGLKALTKATDVIVPLGPYMMYMIPISLVSVAAYILVGKFFFKFDTSALGNSDYAANLKVEPLTLEQKIAILFAGIFVFLLFAPDIIPKNTVMGAIFAKIPPFSAAALLVGVVCFIKIKKDQSLASFAKMTGGLNWNILILMAATTPLGSALEVKDAGIIQALTGSLGPFLSQLSPFIFYAAICLIGCVITQFVHNLVLLAVMTPVFTALAVSIGANPIIVTMCLLLSLMNALGTPGASSRAAIVFGNTEWIAVKDAYVFGLCAVASSLVALLFIGIPWGLLVF